MSNVDPDKMAAAEFNLVLRWRPTLKGSKKSTPPDSPVILRQEDFRELDVERLRNWALKCKTNNLIMMYMLYVADEPSLRHLTGMEGAKKVWPAHQYRKITDWEGRRTRWAPCPLESRYWRGFIKPQLEFVAGILKETGATGGGALELETYCFHDIYPGMASQKKTFCYCDHCFYGFVRSLEETDKLPDAVPPKRRFDWLTQRGMLVRYEQYLEDNLAGLIKQIISEVRQINPEFIFGFYPYAPFWYYDALIRGGGTPELPCLVFPSAEYSGGYVADGPRTYFGDVATPASIAHLRRRTLPAMYAGGLWARNINSPAAVGMAMDRLLRGADGFWIYNDYGHKSKPVPEELWQQARRFNQWTTAHPGPLAAGDIKIHYLPAAIEWVKNNKPEGITVDDGQITARYTGKLGEVDIVGDRFEDRTALVKGWQGRGALPPFDKTFFHSGKSSIRFEPSFAGSEPQSPYIDCKLTTTQVTMRQRYELSFWVRTEADEPVRFWVGQANSGQYPAYMHYRNYVLEPDSEWSRQRIGVRCKKDPPLVLRFWCPPTDGKLWLDNVRLRPVQAQTIDIPLNPPAGVTGWGSIDWRLSPVDARYEATIVDTQTNQLLRTRLYSGDNLKPLAALFDLKPVVLRLQVYPSSSEPVVLEKIQVRYSQ